MFIKHNAFASQLSLGQSAFSLYFSIHTKMNIPHFLFFSPSCEPEYPRNGAGIDDNLPVTYSCIDTILPSGFKN
jgi:hypothetical protein